jgi:hypothetical protein
VETPSVLELRLNRSGRVWSCGGLASQAPLCQVRGQLATKTPTAASPDTIRFLTDSP